MVCIILMSSIELVPPWYLLRRTCSLSSRTAVVSNDLPIRASLGETIPQSFPNTSSKDQTFLCLAKCNVSLYLCGYQLIFVSVPCSETFAGGLGDSTSTSVPGLHKCSLCNSETQKPSVTSIYSENPRMEILALLQKSARELMIMLLADRIFPVSYRLSEKLEVALFIFRPI